MGYMGRVQNQLEAVSDLEGDGVIMPDGTVVLQRTFKKGDSWSCDRKAISDFGTRAREILRSNPKVDVDVSYDVGARTYAIITRPLPEGVDSATMILARALVDVFSSKPRLRRELG